MPSSDTQFKPGHKRGKGRKKGSKNKVSKKVLNAIYENLEDADASLKRLKSENLAAFWRIAAAQIPKDLDIQQTSNVQVSVIQYADLANDDGDE